MRFIPSRVHGVLDYLLGAILILMPWSMGFAGFSFTALVPILTGFALMIISLMTDYELGVIKKLSFSNHLYLDSAMGLFMAISPWLLDFSWNIFIPHVFIGILLALISLMTEAVPAFVLPENDVS